MPRTSAYLALGLTAVLALGGCRRRKANPDYYYAPLAPGQTGTAQPGVVVSGSVAVERPPGEPADDAVPRISAPNLFGNGQGGAFRGLAYVVPEGTKQLPDLRPMVPFAVLFTDSFDIKSQVFTGGFPGALRQDEWFALRFDGRFAVPRGGVYTFELVADDGAVLHVDGQRIIDNDGIHTALPARGTKDLAAGDHRLRLDYFQGKKGAVALQLFLVENGQKTPLVGTRTRP
jgi:hypothetical protein